MFCFLRTVSTEKCLRFALFEVSVFIDASMLVCGFAVLFMSFFSQSYLKREIVIILSRECFALF